MSWVVDTCVLLDLALDDASFADRSELVLESKLDEGLVVCPVTVLELAPQFGGKVSQIRLFLRQTGVADHSPWLPADTESSVWAWHEYVMRKRQARKAEQKRPLADLLIGGFAMRHQGLITRNASHFRPYFPNLTILEP